MNAMGQTEEEIVYENYSSKLMKVHKITKLSFTKLVSLKKVQWKVKLNGLEIAD